MNSLGKRDGHDFADPDYWKKFFAESKGPFEWYGSYTDLASVIEQYVKTTDKILQIGCGNSQLATEMYDNGFYNLQSIDTNARVIKQQATKNRSRAGLVFTVGDATNTGLSEGGFNFVIDKGTLDAMLPPDPSEEQVLNVVKMFNEVKRLLKPYGRYLIVTLAQDHIRDLWLEQLREDFLLRIHKVKNSAFGLKMPVFIFVATRLAKPLPTLRPIEFCHSSSREVIKMESKEELAEAMKAEQELAAFLHLISKPLQEETSMTLCGTNNKEKFQNFWMFLVDKECNSVSKLKTYGIFIVPFGREKEYQYGDPNGRKQLRAECKKDRLAVIHILDRTLTDLVAIKEELDSFAGQWAPVGSLHTTQFQYLTLRDDVSAEALESGVSEINGAYTVNDVETDEGLCRQLVFQSSKNIIQSEALIINDEEADLKQVVLDKLRCSHHEVMLIGLGLLDSKPLLSPETAKLRIAVLGLGGGLLVTYLLRNLPMVKVVAVELDPKVVEVATNYFALPRDDPRLTIFVMDAHQYLDQASSSIFDDDDKLDLLLVDIGGGDDDTLTCPPPSFIAHNALEKMKLSLKPTGILALNFVTRDPKVADMVRGNVKTHFQRTYSLKVDEDINEVIIASPCGHENFDITGLTRKLNSGSNIAKCVAKRLTRALWAVGAPALTQVIVDRND